MKIYYNFRSDRQKLPDAKELFEVVRNFHCEFTTNPSKFQDKYDIWLRSMNQLQPGLFFSFNYDSPFLTFPTNYLQNSSDLKLEMQILDANFIRISFNIDDPSPYKIIPIKI